MALRAVITAFILIPRDYFILFIQAKEKKVKQLEECEWRDVFGGGTATASARYRTYFIVYVVTSVVSYVPWLTDPCVPGVLRPTLLL